MTYFGFFIGMNYGKCNDDFNSYKEIRNEISKSNILEYLKRLPISAVAPMTTKDIFTGEPLEQAGIVEDGYFTFPFDFIHYYEKYDIGIPIEYEKFITSRVTENAEI